MIRMITMITMSSKEDTKMSTDYDLTQRIITAECRIAFGQNIFKQNDKGRYSIGVVFEKDADVANLKELVQEHIKNTWGSKKPSKLFLPIKTEEREDMLQKYPFMEDKIVLNASNGFEIPCIDLHGKELGESDLKSGDYVRLSISAYTYNNVNKGVGFNINGIQKIKEGEAFYGRQSAADMFGVTPASLEEKVAEAEASQEENDDFDF